MDSIRLRKINSKSLKIYCGFHGIQKFANIDKLLTHQTSNPVVARFERAHSIGILTDKPNYCFWCFGIRKKPQHWRELHILLNFFVVHWQEPAPGIAENKNYRTEILQ